MKKQLFTGHLLALFCVAVWGSSFVVSKSLMEHLLPIQLMLLRFVLAYAVLWILHPVWHFRWREEGQFLLMAVFANTLYFLAENTALTLTHASNVSILVSTSPIMTALALCVFQKDSRLTRNQAIGFGVAFAGVVLVVFNGAIALQIKPAGDLLALCAAAFWAAYGLLLRRCSDRYHSFLITRKLMFYGILTALPLLLASGNSIPVAALLNVSSLSKLAYLGIVGSALCYVFWNTAVQRLGILKTTLYINMIPLVTLLISAYMLGEPITLMGVTGMILVITGMILGSLQPET